MLQKNETWRFLYNIWSWNMQSQTSAKAEEYRNKFKSQLFIWNDICTRNLEQESTGSGPSQSRINFYNNLGYQILQRNLNVKKICQPKIVNIVP